MASIEEEHGTVSKGFKYKANWIKDSQKQTN